MRTMLDRMLEPYEAATPAERRLALREISQEVILAGLSRAGFFNGAAFYGGTALRIFYGLDRFSEDMDFSLIEPNPDFELGDFLPTVEKECTAWGFRFEWSEREPKGRSAIRSAFLKADTKEHLLMLYPQEAAADAVAPGERIRIKVEIDTDPAPHAGFQRLFRLLPSPYEVNLYDEPSLFAGKIHAVLCRSWKNRVKGRDLYDYVFYRSKDTAVNVRHLQAKLAQTGHIAADAPMCIEDVSRMLCERFDQIDYEQAKADVLPFIADPRALGLWTPDFFKSITTTLRTI